MEGASQEEGLLFEEDGFSAPRHGLPPGRGQPKSLAVDGASCRPLVKKLAASLEGLPTDTLLMLQSQLPPVPTLHLPLVCVIIAQLLGVSPAAARWLLKPRRRPRLPGRPPSSLQMEGPPPAEAELGGPWLLADPLRSPLRNAIRMAIANAVEGGGRTRGFRDI